jgi:hypothetical protein
MTPGYEKEGNMKQVSIAIALGILVSVVGFVLLATPQAAHAGRDHRGKGRLQG